MTKRNKPSKKTSNATENADEDTLKPSLQDEEDFVYIGAQDGSATGPIDDNSDGLAWPARDQARVNREETADTIKPHSEKPAAESAAGEAPTRKIIPKTSAGEGGSGSNETVNPVVGWLVVIDGPGKGESRTLRVGANAIGRGAKSSVSLDFGDDTISRDRHAIITFDPRSNAFYLERGPVSNLVYLNDELVLSPIELVSGDTITLGRTIVKFIALCSEGFSWS